MRGKLGRARAQREVEITRAGVSLALNGEGTNSRPQDETQAMGEQTKPVAREHEETIAAFDREREEAHELGRRHREIVTNARKNDRLVGRIHDDHDR